MKANRFRLQRTLLLGWITLGVTSAAALAVPNDPLLYTRGSAYRTGSDFLNPAGSRVEARAETTWFGSYTIVNGEYHALSGPNKQSVMWTFDRGIGPYGDPTRIEGGEGWRSIDLTENQRTWFRIADAALDLGDGVPPPIIIGQASLWIGADDFQADSLCYWLGPGYGNDWCQRIATQPLAYDGSGAVSLSFQYFSASEQCFDGTQVYLERADASRLLLNPYDGGGCANDPWSGGFTGVIGSYDAPAVYSRTVTPEEIGGAQSIRFVFDSPSMQAPGCCQEIAE